MKKHQKTMTQEISSQALLTYLQKRKDVRNSYSPRGKTDMQLSLGENLKNITQKESPAIKQSSVGSPKQKQHSIATVFIKEKKQQQLRQNMKLKSKHIQTDTSSEHPTSPLIQKMLHLVSPPSKDKLSNRQLGINDISKKHTRLQSMNSESDLTDKLLSTVQSKQKLLDFRKHSEDFSSKSTLQKPHSTTQFSEFLKQRIVFKDDKIKQAKFLVVLQYKQKRHKVELDGLNSTIGHFIDVIQKKIDQLEGKSGVLIVGVQTIKMSVPLDYILSKRELSIQLLQGFPEQPLIVEPLLQVPKEIKAGKVGLKDFEFIRCIGSGGFSKVYLVRERTTLQYYAMKLIEKNSIFQQNKHSIIQNERIIMQTTNHPFIVQMHYAFESQSYLVFVLEYCSGGELFYLLRKIKKMSEQQAFFYFTEICLALKCLHDNHIVYRDIKPENILIDIHGHLRIADFGLSKPGMSPDDIAYSFCGSPEYMAPEMLLKQGHNFQLDLYCLGALLYELVTGLPPFYCKNTEEIYRRILTQKLTFPTSVNVSSSLKDLLNQLLVKNPKKRLEDIDSILCHPWMQQWGGQSVFLDILERKVAPPFVPDYYRFNFDEKEFGKGEPEFLSKIRILQTTLQENFPRNLLMKDFYYARSDRQSNEQIVDTGGTMNPPILQINTLDLKINDYKMQYSQRSSGKKANYVSNQRMSTAEDVEMSKKQQTVLYHQIRMTTEEPKKFK